MPTNSFNSRSTLDVEGQNYTIHRIDAVENSSRLPYSLKVLLENLLRNEDGRLVTAEQVNAPGRLGPGGRGQPARSSSPRPGC